MHAGRLGRVPVPFEPLRLLPRNHSRGQSNQNQRKSQGQHESQCKAELQAGKETGRKQDITFVLLVQEPSGTDRSGSRCRRPCE